MASSISFAESSFFDAFARDPPASSSFARFPRLAVAVSSYKVFKTCNKIIQLKRVCMFSLPLQILLRFVQGMVRFFYLVVRDLAMSYRRPLSFLHRRQLLQDLCKMTEVMDYRTF